MRTVNRQHLEDAIHNSLLFANAKSWTKGFVQIYGWNANLYFWSTDNFIVNRTLVPGIGALGTDWSVSVSKKDLQWAKAWVNTLDDDITTVNVKLVDDTLRLSVDIADEVNDCTIPVAPPAADWDSIVRIATEAEDVEANVSFALAPDRFRKFSLLHSDDEHPVDFKLQVTEDIGIVVRYQYGPNVSGLIVPLEREAVTYDTSAAVAF